MTSPTSPLLSLSLPVISEIIEVLIIDLNSSEHDWFGHELIQRFGNINTNNITIKQIVNVFVDIIEPMFRPQLLDWNLGEIESNWNRLMIDLKNQDYRKPISTMNKQTICGCDLCDNCPKISGVEEIISFWQYVQDEIDKVENIDYDLLSILVHIHIDEIQGNSEITDHELASDMYYQMYPMED